jgi:serine/threonine protein kinase
MARILQPGERVRGYEVLETIHRGEFAVSYRARATGRAIFLKQYKMPSVRTRWYRAHIDQQAEIKRRIDSTDLRRYACQAVEFFEERDTYYQAFEFIDKGQDLERILEGAARGTQRLTWAQRLVFAKVMMAGIKVLHAQGIVHTDLKPKNLILIPTEASAGYALRLIDMDFSVLVDRQPAWRSDPEFAAVGTPGYRSPEHLRGIPPVAASDVYTCGLILYRLLADTHPYPDEDQKRVLKHSASAPVLLGTMKPPADATQLAQCLRQALSPDPKARPTAEEVHSTLLGGNVPVAKPNSVRLVGSAGQREIRLTTMLGRAVVRGLTEDAQFWDTEQCRLVKDGDGWFVEPCPKAVNETLLNGRAVAGKTPVKDGDVIAVGRQAKKVIKGAVRLALS